VGFEFELFLPISSEVEATIGKKIKKKRAKVETFARF
jgi:hypothetical protein